VCFGSYRRADSAWREDPNDEQTAKSCNGPCCDGPNVEITGDAASSRKQRSRHHKGNGYSHRGCQPPRHGAQRIDVEGGLDALERCPQLLEISERGERILLGLDWVLSVGNRRRNATLHVVEELDFDQLSAGLRNTKAGDERSKRFFETWHGHHDTSVTKVSAKVGRRSSASPTADVRSDRTRTYIFPLGFISFP
jgi:hypothetical protein